MPIQHALPSPPRHGRAARRLATASACLLALLAVQGARTQPARADFATQVLDEANRYRRGQNLPPLLPSEPLAALAAEHSAEMARLGRLSHGGFQERFRRAGRMTCVENLAAGFTDARQLVAGWRASGSHHQNLLDARVHEVGVASVATHVTWLACSSEAAPGR